MGLERSSWDGYGNKCWMRPDRERGDIYTNDDDDGAMPVLNMMDVSTKNDGCRPLLSALLYLKRWVSQSGGDEPRHPSPEGLRGDYDGVGLHRGIGGPACRARRYVLDAVCCVLVYTCRRLIDLELDRSRTVVEIHLFIHAGD